LLDRQSWEPTDNPGIRQLIDPDGKVTYRQTYSAVVQTCRSVTLAADKRPDSAGRPCMAKVNIKDIPELAEDPDKLWAPKKYDVGLITSMQPVVITPKSSYKPCACQCPLKKEAIEGITLVFEYLLHHLYKHGHRTSSSKLQFCQEEVTFGAIRSQEREKPSQRKE